MSARNKMPPKVSGLIGSGKLGPVSGEMLNRMPAFEAGPPDRVESGPSLPADAPDRVWNIPVEKVRRSRFQNRLGKDDSAILDLAENIKADGLNNPIVVRPMEDGLFELISGETRLDAMVRMGHTEVPARVRPMSDLQAARSTVLDNMFHNPLSDYETYKGFKTLLELGAVKSVSGLSRETPYSKSQVHRLMAFGKLPEEAMSLLDAHPGLVGANIAEALADWSAKGHPGLVLKALERVRDGTLKQMRAPSWIESQVKERVRPQKVVVTRGDGQPYATLVRTGGTIRITTASEADAEELAQMLVGLLSAER